MSEKRKVGEELEEGVTISKKPRFADGEFPIIDLEDDEPLVGDIPLPDEFIEKMCEAKEDFLVDANQNSVRDSSKCVPHDLGQIIESTETGKFIPTVTEDDLQDLLDFLKEGGWGRAWEADDVPLADSPVENVVINEVELKNSPEKIMDELRSEINALKNTINLEKSPEVKTTSLKPDLVSTGDSVILDKVQVKNAPVSVTQEATKTQKKMFSFKISPEEILKEKSVEVNQDAKSTPDVTVSLKPDKVSTGDSALLNGAQMKNRPVALTQEETKTPKTMLSLDMCPEKIMDEFRTGIQALKNSIFLEKSVEVIHAEAKSTPSIHREVTLKPVFVSPNPPAKTIEKVTPEIKPPKTKITLGKPPEQINSDARLTPETQRIVTATPKPGLVSTSDSATLKNPPTRITQNALTELQTQKKVIPSGKPPESTNPNLKPTPELKQNEKPSLKPAYISTDPSENRDNFNEGWAPLREASSDEVRYRLIRERWRNLSVPDPAKNLTFRHIGLFSYPERKNQAHRSGGHRRTVSCSSVFEREIITLRNQKRRREHDLQCEQSFEINQLSIKHTQQLCQLRNCCPFPNFPELQFQQTRELAALFQRHADEIRHATAKDDAEIEKLTEYMNEVRSFHGFYNGLLKDRVDKTVLSDEQTELKEEVEKMFQAYKRFY